MSLRRRLTKTIAAPLIENPLQFARGPHGFGATINNESSPSFESFLEEKSLLDQVNAKSNFVNTLRQKNSKLENCLMSSLSQRLEWLRLNNSFGQSTVLESSGDNNQGRGASAFHKAATRKLENDDEEEERAVKRLKNCDSSQEPGAVRRRCRRTDAKRASCCDRLRAKTDPRRVLMGLTLPMGKLP